MASVVIELQREALDRSIPASDLLRKALVVARKLSLPEFQSWIDRELNGASGTYNGQHLPLTVTDAAGVTTSYTYNAAGQVLTVTTQAFPVVHVLQHPLVGLPPLQDGSVGVVASKNRTATASRFRISSS